MEEKTQKTAFYVFIGIAVAAFVLAIVALCTFTFDVNVKENNLSIIALKDGLFGITDSLPTSIIKKFSEETYNAHFAENIAEISTSGITIALIIILIGGAGVAGGYAVRIFAKKRTVAKLVNIGGMTLALVGGILLMVMLTKTNGDMNSALRVGFERLIKVMLNESSSSSQKVIEAMKLMNIRASVTTASVFMPLVAAVLTIIIGAIQLVKPFKNTEF